MDNIIIDNRIVSDKTFATRSLILLRDLWYTMEHNDFSDLEFAYVWTTLYKLLETQVNTCTKGSADDLFLSELINNKPLSAHSIVTDFICKNKRSFKDYLKQQRLIPDDSLFADSKIGDLFLTARGDTAVLVDFFETKPKMFVDNDLVIYETDGTCYKGERFNIISKKPKCCNCNKGTKSDIIL